MPAATGLLADEIKLFREFTLKQPVVATTTLDIAADKRLMFASLCGSNNYFGDSGCSLTGYAADGADSIWRMVYETEGVHVYLDPEACQWRLAEHRHAAGRRRNRADALGVVGRPATSCSTRSRPRRTRSRNRATPAQ